jgi:hypothetical protein
MTLKDSADGSLGNVFGADGKANFATAGMVAPWTRTLIVDAGGKGDYTTPEAACAYVATQSPSSTATNPTTSQPARSEVTWRHGKDRPATMNRPTRKGRLSD